MIIVNLMRVQQLALADPLLGLGDALGHREDVLEAVHGRHVLRVARVLLPYRLQRRHQGRDAAQTLLHLVHPVGDKLDICPLEFLVTASSTYLILFQFFY